MFDSIGTIEPRMVVVGSVTCIHFVPEVIERLVQQKKNWWKTLVPRKIYAELVNEGCKESYVTMGSTFLGRSEKLIGI